MNGIFLPQRYFCCPNVAFTLRSSQCHGTDWHRVPYYRYHHLQFNCPESSRKRLSASGADTRTLRIKIWQERIFFRLPVAKLQLNHERQILAFRRMHCSLPVSELNSHENHCQSTIYRPSKKQYSHRLVRARTTDSADSI